ncbi:MAG TPA: hypothetical protein VJV03_11665 [Pyrinomonadaceae bacterium]|nr:hypothetical protein [Pyrinomonadaceae bacterium]
MDLKERTVYQLPNGREVFVRITKDDKAILYSLSAAESAQYTFDTEGRLLVDGELTPWDLDDLSDTGRTAPPEVTGVLAGATDTKRKIEH